MGRCCVISCNSSKDNFLQPGVTFYNFPTDEGRRRAWIKAVGRINWTPSIYSVICSKHFKESDFLLKEDAVPVLTQKRICYIPNVNIQKIVNKDNSNEHENSEESHCQSENSAKRRKPFRISDISDSESLRLKNKTSIKCETSNVTSVSTSQESSSSIQDSNVLVVYRNNQPSLCAYPITVCKLCKSKIPNDTQIFPCNNSSTLPNSVQDSSTILKKSSVASGSSTINYSSQSTTFLNAPDKISQPANIFHTGKSDATIHGRRIIDFEYVLNRLKSLNQHSKLGCNLNHIVITLEKKVGLSSFFYIKCRMCGFKSIILTECPTKQSINADIVWGMMDINCRLLQINNLLLKMKLPLLSTDVFTKEHEKILSSDVGKRINVAQDSRLIISCALNEHENSNQFDFNQIKVEDQCESKGDTLINESEGYTQISENGTDISEKEGDIQNKCDFQKILPQNTKLETAKDILVANDENILNTFEISNTVNSNPHNNEINGLQTSRVEGLNNVDLFAYFTNKLSKHKYRASENKMHIGVAELESDKAIIKQKSKDDVSKSDSIHAKTIDQTLLVVNENTVLNASVVEEEMYTDRHNDKLNCNSLLENDDPTNILSQHENCAAFEDKIYVDVKEVQFNKILEIQKDQDIIESESIHTETKDQDDLVVNEDTLETTIIKKECDVSDGDLNGSQVREMEIFNRDNPQKCDDDFKLLSPEQKCEAYEGKMDILADQIQLNNSADKLKSKNESKSEFIYSISMNKDDFIAKEGNMLNTTRMRKENNSHDCNNEFNESECVEMKASNNDSNVEHDSKSEFIHSLTTNKDIFVAKEKEMLSTTKMRKGINSHNHIEELNEFHVNEMKVSNNDSEVEHNNFPNTLSQPEKCKTFKDNVGNVAKQILLNETLVNHENKDQYKPESIQIVSTNKDILIVNEEKMLNAVTVQNKINSDVHNYKLNKSEVNEIKTSNDDSFVDPCNILSQPQELRAFKDEVYNVVEQIALNETRVKQENKDDSKSEFINIKTTDGDNLFVNEETMLSTIRIKKEINSDVEDDELHESQVSEVKISYNDNHGEHDGPYSILFKQQKNKTTEHITDIVAEQTQLNDSLVKEKHRDNSKSEFVHMKATNEDILFFDEETMLNTTRIKKEINSDVDDDDELNESQVNEIQVSSNDSHIEHDGTVLSMMPSSTLLQSQESKTSEDEAIIVVGQIQLNETLVTQKNKGENKSEFICIRNTDQKSAIVIQEETLNTNNIKKEINSDDYDVNLNKSQVGETEISNTESHLEYEGSSKMLSQQLTSRVSENEINFDSELTETKTYEKHTLNNNSHLVCDGLSGILSHQHRLTDIQEKILNVTNIKKEISFDVCSDKSTESVVNEMETADSDSLKNDKSSVVQKRKIIAYIDKISVDTKQIKLLKTLIKEENPDGSDLHELNFVDMETIRKNISLVDQEKTLNATKDINLDVFHDELTESDNTEMDIMGIRRIKKEINLDEYHDESTGSISEMEKLNKNSCLEYDDFSGMLPEQQKHVASADELTDVKKQTRLNKIIIVQKNEYDKDLSESEFSDNKTRYKDISSANKETTLDSPSIMKKNYSNVCNNELTKFQINEMETVIKQGSTEESDLYKLKFSDSETIQRDETVIDGDETLLRSSKRVNSAVYNNASTKSDISETDVLNSNSPKYNDNVKTTHPHKKLRTCENKVVVKIPLHKMSKKHGNQESNVISESEFNEMEVVQEDISMAEQEKLLYARKVEGKTNSNRYFGEVNGSKVGKIESLTSDSALNCNGTYKISLLKKRKAYKSKINVNKTEVKGHKTVVKLRNQDDKHLKKLFSFDKETRKTVILSSCKNTLNKSKNKRDINSVRLDTELNKPEVRQNHNPLETDSFSRMLTTQKKLMYLDKIMKVDKKQVKINNTIGKRKNQCKKNLHTSVFNDVSTNQDSISSVGEEAVLATTNIKEKSSSMSNDSELHRILIGYEINKAKTLKSDKHLENNSFSAMLCQVKNIGTYENKIIVDEGGKIYNTTVKDVYQDYNESNKSEIETIKIIQKNDKENTLNSENFENELKSDICNNRLIQFQADGIKISNSSSLLECNDSSRMFFQQQKNTEYESETNINKGQIKLCKTLTIEKNQSDNYSGFIDSETINKDISVVDQETEITSTKRTKKEMNFDACVNELTVSETSETVILTKDNLSVCDDPSVIVCPEKELRMCKGNSVFLNKKVKLHKAKKKTTRNDRNLPKSEFNDSMIGDKDFVNCNNQSKAETITLKETIMNKNKLIRQKLTKLGDEKNKQKLPLHCKKKNTDKSTYTLYETLQNGENLNILRNIACEKVKQQGSLTYHREKLNILIHQVNKKSS